MSVLKGHPADTIACSSQLTCKILSFSLLCQFGVHSCNCVTIFISIFMKIQVNSQHALCRLKVDSLQPAAEFDSSYEEDKKINK